MTSSIGTTSTGGIFIGGTSSGLDTTALIEAAVAQKTARADAIQVEVDENTETIAAYDELLGLAGAVESSLSALRGPSSLFDDTTRVWDQRAGSVSMSNNGDYLNFAEIAVDSDASEGSYDIEIIREALVHKVRGTDVADNTAALGYVGTFDLNLNDGGAAIQISVAAGDSLKDIAASINAQSTLSNVSASVIKVSESAYQLVLQGVNTAYDIQVQNVTGDDVLNLLGVTDGVGGFNNLVQASQDAEIEVDGISITRDDNNFDDVITGIDIDVRKATAGETLRLEVGNDTVAAKEAIVAFIEAYNAFRAFVTKNQQVDSSGEVAEGAILFSDNLLNGLADEYSDYIAQSFNSGGVIETIRDLGITIGNNNRLILSDETKLDIALLNNFDDVRKAFAANAETDNVEFRLTGNTAAAASQSIVFDITTDGAGTITSVSANGDGSAFTISGGSVVGASGTAYEGLRFTYVGTDASATINVDFNQGLSEKLLNGAKGYTDPVTGLIQQEKSLLQSRNTEKLADAQSIIEKAEAFRESQIQKYAKLEADLQALNTLLDQIRAILGNNDDDN